MTHPWPRPRPRVRRWLVLVDGQAMAVLDQRLPPDGHPTYVTVTTRRQRGYWSEDLVIVPWPTEDRLQGVLKEVLRHRYYHHGEIQVVPVPNQDTTDFSVN